MKIHQRTPHAVGAVQRLTRTAGPIRFVKAAQIWRSDRSEFRIEVCAVGFKIDTPGGPKLGLRLREFAVKARLMCSMNLCQPRWHTSIPKNIHECWRNL